MKRLRNLFWLLAMAATLALQTDASAANVWLSLNLAFNTPGNPNSGGTWTTVAKAEPQGIAGVNMNLANATTFTAFLAPPQLDVRMQGIFGAVRNVVVGDDLTPPYPLGIGVIGSSFPSTYVDPPGLVPFGGNADYGSFTGGVALATGTFAPGVVPDWTTQGPLMNASDANLFTGPSGPVVDADTLLTVRHVVPEPAALYLAGLGAVAIVMVMRRRP